MFVILIVPFIYKQNNFREISLTMGSGGLLNWANFSVLYTVLKPDTDVQSHSQVDAGHYAKFRVDARHSDLPSWALKLIM